MTRPIATSAELHCTCQVCGEIAVYEGETLDEVRDMADNDGWNWCKRICRLCARRLRVTVAENTACVAGAEVPLQTGR